MSYEKPPELARCDEHGIVLVEDSSGSINRCVTCELHVEPRLDTIPENDTLTEPEFRNRLDWETTRELIPLMEAYLEDMFGESEIWVTHIPWERQLPAGYTEQERFVLAVGYRFDHLNKWVLKKSNAQKTIQTLREEGYDD